MGGALPRSPGDSVHKRILIVDDEPAIRDMVAYALRKGDFEPVHAGDAREAQAAIAARMAAITPVVLEMRRQGIDAHEQGPDRL